MLRELLGVALVGMGVLTIYARVLARSIDLSRRPARNPLSSAASHRNR